IRDRTVTGVQTCALPISSTNRKLPLLGRSSPRVEAAGSQPQSEHARAGLTVRIASAPNVTRPKNDERIGKVSANQKKEGRRLSQIGRASCREKVESSEGK